MVTIEELIQYGVIDSADEVTAAEWLCIGEVHDDDFDEHLPDDPDAATGHPWGPDAPPELSGDEVYWPCQDAHGLLVRASWDSLCQAWDFYAVAVHGHDGRTRMEFGRDEAAQ